MKHFSLSTWHDYKFQYGLEFTFFRLDFDSYWRPNAAVLSYVALSVAALGLHASLVFWPRGKDQAADPANEELFDALRDIGREHGEAGE